MDLLALSTFDNLVELYRISYKAQRVFQSDEGKPVKGLAFSPDCNPPPMQPSFWPTPSPTASSRS
jgi:hypothetical protein